MNDLTLRNLIDKDVQESIAAKELFFRDQKERIAGAALAIAKSFVQGGKVLLFGNGGSATDASHIAAEFVNRFLRERRGLPAIALNTDPAVMTSIANDYDYANIFDRQLQTLAVPGDVAVAISTSGGSPNVLKAAQSAKGKKLTLIVLTGQKGATLASFADFPFVVPTTNTPRIQEVHITLGHILCHLVEEILFGRP